MINRRTSAAYTIKVVYISKDPRTSARSKLSATISWKTESPLMFILPALYIAALSLPMSYWFTRIKMWVYG